MLIHEAFDKTLKDYGISGKVLAQQSGVSTSHISQFRNGKGGDVAHTTLEKLLNTLNKLAPGAKSHFCSLWLSKGSSLWLSKGAAESEVDALISKLGYSELNDEQLAQLVLLAGSQLKEKQLSRIPAAV